MYGCLYFRMESKIFSRTHRILRNAAEVNRVRKLKLKENQGQDGDDGGGKMVRRSCRKRFVSRRLFDSNYLNKSMPQSHRKV